MTEVSSVAAKAHNSQRRETLSRARAVLVLAGALAFGSAFGRKWQVVEDVFQRQFNRTSIQLVPAEDEPAMLHFLTPLSHPELWKQHARDSIKQKEHLLKQQQQHFSYAADLISDGTRSSREISKSRDELDTLTPSISGSCDRQNIISTSSDIRNNSSISSSSSSSSNSSSNNDSNHNSSLHSMSWRRQVNRELMSPQQSAVAEAVAHSWKGYREFSFGLDELHPLSKRGGDWFTGAGLGLTLVDSLDLLWLVGDDQAFQEAKEWVASEMVLDGTCDYSSSVKRQEKPVGLV
jgi:hypothetical protein